MVVNSPKTMSSAEARFPNPASSIHEYNPLSVTDTLVMVKTEHTFCSSLYFVGLRPPLILPPITNWTNWPAAVDVDNWRYSKSIGIPSISVLHLNSAVWPTRVTASLGPAVRSPQTPTITCLMLSIEDSKVHDVAYDQTTCQLVHHNVSCVTDD